MDLYKCKMLDCKLCNLPIYQKGRQIINFKTVRSLVERMKTESLHELLTPIDRYGYLLTHATEEEKKYHQSLRSGHLLERIVEILILFGVSCFENTVNVYEGKIPSLQLINNIDNYLDSKINRGTSSGEVDIYLQDKITKEYFYGSCKFYNKEKSADNYDLGKIDTTIKTFSKKYNNFQLMLILQNKSEFLTIKNRARSDHIKRFIDKRLNDKLVFGLDDLNHWLNKFQQLKFYTINCDKKHLHLHLHQKIISTQCACDILSLKNKTNMFLIGAIPRTGKCYICAGIIIELIPNRKKLHVLITTTHPNETRHFIQIFKEHVEFKDCIIRNIDNKYKYDEKENKHPSVIHFTSKQYIQDKINHEDRIFSEYDLIMIDEIHDGFTTELSKKIIKFYSHLKTNIIGITATYNKPVVMFNIPKQYCYYWDLIDINNMKNGNFDCLNRFPVFEKEINKSKEALEEIVCEDIVDYYSKFPKMCRFTNSYNETPEYKKLYSEFNTRGVGFNMLNLFQMENGIYKNPGSIKTFFNCFTGNGLHKDHIKNAPLERIKSHMRSNGENHNFIGMLWFLPFGINNKIINGCRNLKKIMEEENTILKQYEIICINDVKKKNIANYLIDEEKKAKEDGKHGIIILCGKKGALGISLPFVNIVCLFTHFTNSDIICHMSYRSMTESYNKKHGYIVDMNPNRNLQAIIDIGNGNSKKDKKKYLTEIIGNIIEIDPDMYKYKVDFGEQIVNEYLELWNNKQFPGSIEKKFLKYLNKIELVIPNNLTTIKCVNNKIIIKYSGLEYKRNGLSSENEEKIERDTKLTKKRKQLKKKVRELTSEQMKEYFYQAINIFIHSAIFLCIEKDFDLTIIIENIMDNEYLKRLVEDKINNSLYLNLSINELSQIILNNLCVLEYYIITIRDKMANINGDKKKLLEEITKLLIPKEKEKNEKGEVFTPLKAIETMLDIFNEEYKDENLFENENLTWFDPTNGIGNFLVCIYYRLMDGLKLKIVDEEKRRKHIIEKMLFGYEINEYNVEISKRIFNSNKYKVNLDTGDFLKYKSKYKHSITIGNPPYQADKKLTGGSSHKQIYHNFVEKALEVSDKVFMITKSNWFCGGTGLEKFRDKMLKCKKIKYIKHFNSSKDVFPKLGIIEGGVSFLLVDNNYKGSCKFNNTIVNLSTYDIIPIELECIPLIEKIKNQKKFLSDMFMSQLHYGVKSNDERLLEEKDEKSIICYVSSKQSKDKRIKYINIKKFEKCWKVIIARANGSKKNFGNIIIGTNNEVYSQSYVAFRVDDEKSADSLKSYLLCKFPNVLMGLRKITQDISTKTCKWIPLVPLDRIWTDTDVYKHFKLSDDDIKIVDNYCKKYKFKINLFEPVKGELKETNILLIDDEIKVIKDGGEEVLKTKNIENFKIDELKQICKSNKITMSGCKNKKDFVNLIMSQNRTLEIK
jgi:site-specific DNA-methyltransferase (adenine-specific)